ELAIIRREAKREREEPRTDGARAVVEAQLRIDLGEDVVGDVREVPLRHPEPSKRGPYVVVVVLEEATELLMRRVGAHLAGHSRFGSESPVLSQQSHRHADAQAPGGE